MDFPATMTCYWPQTDEFFNTTPRFIGPNVYRPKADETTFSFHFDIRNTHSKYPARSSETKLTPLGCYQPQFTQRAKTWAFWDCKANISDDHPSRFRNNTVMRRALMNKNVRTLNHLHPAVTCSTRTNPINPHIASSPTRRYIWKEHSLCRFRKV